MRVPPKMIIDESIGLVQRAIGDAVRTALTSRYGSAWAKADELRNELQKRRDLPARLEDPADFVRICSQQWNALAAMGPKWMRADETRGHPKKLHQARNDGAHSSDSGVLKRSAIAASESANKLLNAAGKSDLARIARLLHRRASRADAVDLRRRLIALAHSGNLVDYHPAAQSIDLDFDDDFERKLFVDALNETAEENVALDEPFLCAIVVDLQSSLPTIGFWRRLNLSGKDPIAQRRTAHGAAVQQVRNHNWSSRP